MIIQLDNKLSMDEFNKLSKCKDLQMEITKKVEFKNKRYSSSYRGTRNG